MEYWIRFYKQLNSLPPSRNSNMERSRQIAMRHALCSMHLKGEFNKAGANYCFESITSHHLSVVPFLYL
jgi:hypothetical protein